MRFLSKHHVMRYLPFLLVIAACNMPDCKNTNPVFDKNAPNTAAYNAELVKEMEANKASLRYWVNEYKVEGADTFLTVFVQGKALCAQMWLNINHTTDDRLQNLKARKAVSYSGAELDGLQYQVVPDSGNYRFIYQKVDHIWD